MIRAKLSLRERLTTLIALAEDDRALLRGTVRRVVEERWSWAGIARRLLELARQEGGG